MQSAIIPITHAECALHHDSEVELSPWELPLGHHHRIADPTRGPGLLGDQLIADHFGGDLLRLSGAESERVISLADLIPLESAHVKTTRTPPLRPFLKCPLPRPPASTWAFSTRFFVFKSVAICLASCADLATPNLRRL